MFPFLLSYFLFPLCSYVWIGWHYCNDFCMSIPGLSPLPALILHQDKYSVCCLVPPLLRPSLVSALTLARLTGPSQSQIHRYTTHHNQQKYKQIKRTLWDHSKPLMRCSELFRSWNGWDNSSRCYSP